MGSIGWLILGYIVLGIVMEIVASIGIAIYAAVLDFKYDKKHDPDMKKTDTLDALNEVGDWCCNKLKDDCNVTENPEASYAYLMLKSLLLWPYSIPKGLTLMWRNSLELRKIRNGH